MALCHDMIYVRIICFLCFEVTFFVSVFGPIILLVFFVTLAVRTRRSNGKVGQIGDRWKGPFKAESFSSLN